MPEDDLSTNDPTAAHEVTPEEAYERALAAAEFSAVTGRLLTTATPRGVIQWWGAANRQLDDRTPIDVLSDDGAEGRRRVSAAAAALVDGAYA